MKPLIVITGPTACGKTRTAIQVAKQINGEIISADSMQVYCGMDIGTAKPTLAERQGIPHHMIDVVMPDESFSAARYKQMAVSAVESVHARGWIPVLTGGTGFYINSIVYDVDFSTDTEDEAEIRYRKALQGIADENGVAYLHTLLRQADPDAADAIHPNNVKRVARALSFYHFTGQRISQRNAEQRKNPLSYADTLYVVLDMERARLYERIDNRVDEMFSMGLAEEVQRLLDAGYHENLVSMQGLGYKETARYLRGVCTRTEAADAIKTGTRRYAKRQLTWFKHRAPEAKWLTIEPTSPDSAVESIIQYIKGAHHE